MSSGTFFAPLSNMESLRKLTTVSVPVPYRGAGNTIREHEVSFDVFEEGETLHLVPLLNVEERRVANLPPELVCHIENGRPISHRGDRDGNIHVIEEVVAALRSTGRPD